MQKCDRQGLPSVQKSHLLKPWLLQYHLPVKKKKSIYKSNKGVRNIGKINYAITNSNLIPLVTRSQESVMMEPVHDNKQNSGNGIIFDLFKLLILLESDIAYIQKYTCSEVYFSF